MGFEGQLTAAGNSLSQPPSSLDALLCLLDRIEVILSKVEQSPGKYMLIALSQLMDALIAEDLLKHFDVDVKVGVASCISEIIRITAPVAPYDDDKMKEVFHLIVSSFENFSDTSSRSYHKRASILETMASVKSYVVMLDLECNQMITEMFQHFFRAVRVHHSEIIFASMETVMTYVIEESGDISLDLLNLILTTLQRNNEEALPNARKLAEKVFQNCAEKLRPYLIQAFQTSEKNMEKAKHTMKLLVDTESNRALFAEVNKDCVDFLLELLSLPLATVTGLLKEQGMLGSLQNLCTSIQNLKDDYIQPGQSKNTLLEPMLPACATSLPTQPDKKFYGCCNCRSDYISDGPNAICPNCRYQMNSVKTYVAPPSKKQALNGGGFMKGVVTYMVTDGLMVEPLSTIGSITLLNKLNVQKLSTLRETVVNLTMNEALMLLKASLYTDEVLTEVFVKGQYLGSAS